MEKENILILHDIRSAQNVGAIFRTADACGIDKIVISGHSPCPLDRFGRKRSDVAKSALGAEESVSWEYVSDIFSFIKEMKHSGFFVVALEQAENSVDYKEVQARDKNIFILGSEVAGVSKDLLDLADVVAEIPMKGKKESLNVSVATGVALFRILGV